ncbi:MAG: hypothetical protein GX595_07310 [Lentisphaerae bacterium]|nr:hypothetical protein [Lentisphaerota bacterium]
MPTSRAGSDRPRRGRCRCFTLIETLIVVALLAAIFALALPRLGRLPARLQIEQNLSTLRAAFDEVSLRARATGQALRVTLEVDTADGGSRLAVAGVAGDPFAPALGGLPSAGLGAAPDGAAEAGARLGAMVPGADSYALPSGVEWDEASLQQGSRDGAEGPVFIFLGSGEAGGPALEFTIRRQRFRLAVDPLTGRADIRALEAP